MNIINAQKEILGLALKGGKRVIFDKSSDENKVYFGTEFLLYVVNKNQVGIDFENLANVGQNFNAKRSINDGNARPLQLTNTVIESEKRCFRILLNDKNEEIWIDAKLFKNFSLEFSRFKGTDPMHLVFVYEKDEYENEEMVGVLVPVKPQNLKKK